MSPPRCALVFDFRMPDVSRDAGSAYSIGLMRILVRLGFAVYHYSATGDRALDPRSVDLGSYGIRELPSEQECLEFLQSCNRPDCLVIVNSMVLATSVWETIRRVAPSARLVFSVIDIHFVRELREAKLSGNEESKRTAEENKQKELAFVRDADATIVTSEIEAQVLREETPSSRVFVILLPYAMDVPATYEPVATPFESRRGVAFIGSFWHAPNIDAAEFLINAIRPAASALGLHDEFMIVGSKMPAEWKNLGVEGVRFLGHVHDLTELFGRIALTIAPVRYGGAGLKGKVATSFLGGVPCVMTPVAAEGYGFGHEMSDAIGETAEELAQCILNLCASKSRWEDVERIGYERCVSILGYEQGARALTEIMSLPIAR